MFRGSRIPHGPRAASSTTRACLIAALAAGFAAPAAQARVVLESVAGTTMASVVVGDGVIFSSDALQRSWTMAEGVDANVHYTCVATTQSGMFIVGAENGSVWASATASADGFVLRAQAAGAAIRGIRQSQGQLLAVGDGGLIRRSFDLTGGSWVVVASPTAQNLRDLAVNATTAVVVGENGTILRGGALGTDFEVVDLGVSNTFYSVVSNPSANGSFLAVGERGEMWESLPNGLTWTRVDAGISETLRGAAQIGPATVVVGQGGAIYYSSGGFDNWGAASVSSSGNELFDAFYTGSTALACGVRRTVLWSEIGTNWIQGDVTPSQETTWGRVKSRYLGSGAGDSPR